jgi:ribosomal-protein-alanine N-acetyltransferase
MNFMEIEGFSRLVFGTAMSQTEPVFKPLLPEDIEAVSAIESQVYEDPWSRALLEQSLQAPMTHTLGLWKGDELIGYAIFQIIFTEAHLLNLAISKNFQKSGYGGRMLEEVMRVSREKMAQAMYLEVRPSNHGGRHLYEKYGFKTLMVRDRYYANGEAALVMVLDFLESKAL